MVSRSSSLNQSICSGVPPGIKREVNTLAKCRVVAIPADLHEIEQRPGLADLRRRRIALHGASRICPRVGSRLETRSGCFAA